MNKRYFKLEFQCQECDERLRFKELENDMMGRQHCPECNGTNFRVVRRKVSYNSFIKHADPDEIIMIETKLARR